MQIPDTALNEMLKELPPAQRKSLAHIISGKITHQVHCNSKTCAGDVIAYLYQDGIDPSTRRPRSHVEPFVGADKAMKLRASRKRLDGFYGFQCWCGADSRIAAQEQGSIGYTGKPPTRKGLQTIYKRLQKNPPNYPEFKGVREVDGFSIERLS